MNRLDHQAIRVRIVTPAGDVVFRVDVPAEVVNGRVVVAPSAFDLEEGAQLEVADNAQPHATQTQSPDEVLNDGPA